MSFTKITDDDREDMGVTGLDDTPELTTEEMQIKFDELGNLAIDGLNTLIDELEATTGAESIGSDIPDGYSCSANVASVTSAIVDKVDALEDEAHTHDNLTTLDAITASTKTEYDRIASVMTNIDSVSSTVSDDSTVLPTGHAIVNYVSTLGGGDMMQATYDTDGDGIVDNAETVSGYSVTEDSSDIESGTANTIPSSAALSSLLETYSDLIDDKIPYSAIESELSSDTTTVPSSYLLNSTYTELSDTLTDLATNAIQFHDGAVKEAGSTTTRALTLTIEPGYIYIFITRLNKITDSAKGVPTGNIGVTLKYVSLYYSSSTIMPKMVTQSIISPNSNVTFVDQYPSNYLGQTVVSVKTGYILNVNVYRMATPYEDA